MSPTSELKYALCRHRNQATAITLKPAWLNFPGIFNHPHSDPSPETKLPYTQTD